MHIDEDADYLIARADAERHCAQTAADPQARAIHLQLAEQYEQRLRALDPRTATPVRL